jgi:hypothetical protein
MNTEIILNEINGLILNPLFRQSCATTAKANGISAEEWNENKVNILFLWATQIVCGDTRPPFDLHTQVVTITPEEFEKDLKSCLTVIGQLSSGYLCEYVSPSLHKKVIEIRLSK